MDAVSGVVLNSAGGRKQSTARKRGQEAGPGGERRRQLREGLQLSALLQALSDGHSMGRTKDKQARPQERKGEEK